MLRIGVDFDGVIADNTRELQRFYLDRFGIQMSVEALSKENQIKILGGLGKYCEVHRMLNIGISTLRNDVVPNCKQVLNRLISEGHKIIILTGREELAWERAKEFMKANKIPYHHMLFNNMDRDFRKKTGERKTKALISRELKMGIFIDDVITHLDLMSCMGIKLFLFTTAQNKSIKISKPDIQRVFDWKDIYERISLMSKEKAA
jgi:uncharacterized HAD superfamily protein